MQGTSSTKDVWDALGRSGKEEQQDAGTVWTVKKPWESFHACWVPGFIIDLNVAENIV